MNVVERVLDWAWVQGDRALLGVTTHGHVITVSAHNAHVVSTVSIFSGWAQRPAPSEGLRVAAAAWVDACVRDLPSSLCRSRQSLTRVACRQPFPRDRLVAVVRTADGSSSSGGQQHLLLWSSPQGAGSGEVRRGGRSLLPAALPTYPHTPLPRWSTWPQQPRSTARCVGSSPTAASRLCPHSPTRSPQVATLACSGAYALLGFESGLCRVYSLEDGSPAGEWSLPETAPTACTFVPPWGERDGARAVMVVGHWPDAEGAVASVYTLGPSADVARAGTVTAPVTAGPCVLLAPARPAGLTPDAPLHPTAAHAWPRAGTGTTWPWACPASRRQCFTGCGFVRGGCIRGPALTALPPFDLAGGHWGVCANARPHTHRRRGGRGLAPDAALRRFLRRRRGLALLCAWAPLASAGSPPQRAVAALL